MDRREARTADILRGADSLIRHPAKVFWVLIGLNLMWAPVNWAIQSATASATPIAVALVRFGLFASIMWAALSSKLVREKLGVILPQRADAIKAMIIGLLLAGPAHALYYSALKTAGTAETTTINTTGPFWTTLFAIVILGERVTVLRWFAIFAGALGAYWVAIGFSPLQFSDGSQQSNLMYLSGTMMECLAFALSTKLLRRSSGLGVLAYEMLGVAICMVLAPFLMPQILPLQFGSLGWQFFVAMAYLVLIAGVVCFGVWYSVAEKAPVSLMLVTLGVQAPVASLIAITLLGEQASPGLVVGTSVILLALGVGAWEAKSREDKGDVGMEAEFLPEPS